MAKYCAGCYPNVDHDKDTDHIVDFSSLDDSDEEGHEQRSRIYGSFNTMGGRSPVSLDTNDEECSPSMDECSPSTDGGDTHGNTVPNGSTSSLEVSLATMAHGCCARGLVLVVLCLKTLCLAVGLYYRIYLLLRWT